MKYIDDLIRESDKIAVQVAVNDYIYDFLTSENQNSVANISTLYRLLSTWISNSKYINSIYVYDVERGSFISLPQGIALAGSPSWIPNGPVSLTNSGTT